MLRFFLPMLLACGPDSRKRDAIDYVERIQPLMNDNQTMQREFLDIAAQIKKDEIAPQELADRLKQRVIPRAIALEDAVRAVQPQTEALADVHRGLTRAWSNRAAAYTRMHEAWEAGDLAVFNAAAGDHTTVRKAEARYHQAISAVLEPYDLKLDPYP